ncbi:MAG: hypothetical protein AB7I79_15820 [Rhizobiaceae bacterium]
MQKTLPALAVLAILAGCGQDEAQPPAQTGDVSIRMAEFEGRKARCEAGETIMNAYCFIKPNGSVSASSVLFIEAADGTMEVECVAGGRDIRIFCLKN